MVELICQGNQKLVFSRYKRQSTRGSERLVPRGICLIGAQDLSQTRLSAIDGLAGSSDHRGFKHQPVTCLVFADRSDERRFRFAKAKQIVNRASMILPTKDGGLQLCL